ncbi:conserved hypothetical protein, partial [Trichinella spiralis]
MYLSNHCQNTADQQQYFQISLASCFSLRV